MRSVIYAGHGRFELDPEASMPQVGERDVLVKVRFCGVCGSDLHLFQNIDHVQPGQALGHEISGVVAEVGRAVQHVRPGDRVTALTGGGYAEYCVAPLEKVIPLASHVTFQQAALSEPFAVGLRAVRDSGLKIGDRAGVVGTGPIGLYTMLAARAAGALEVYAAEVSPARLQAAQRLGARAAFNPRTQNVAEELAKLAPDGLDVVYDCSGAKGTLELALSMVKKGGMVMLVGISGLPGEFNYRWVFAKHARVQPVPGALEVWPLAVQLITAGRVDPAAIISGVVTLDDLPRAMAELMDPMKHVQVMVDPWGPKF